MNPQYHVRLDKHASIWSYFTTNPQGGGSGSSHRGSKALALILATRNIPAGSTYVVVTNGKPSTIQTKGAL